MVPDDLVQPFRIDPFALRGRLVRLGPAIDRILSQHAYPEPVAAMLGEAITLAVLLAGALKYDGIFTLQTKGDGPIRLMVADVSTDGAVRGYAQYDAAKLDAARDRAPRAASRCRACSAPAISPLPSTRARTPTATRGSSSWPGRPSPNARSIISGSRSRSRRGSSSSVAPCRARCAWRAGGLMLQRVPPEGGYGVIADDVEDGWRRAMVLMSSATAGELVDPGLSPHRLLFRLFHEDGVRVFDTHPLEARCRCSRERIECILRAVSGRRARRHAPRSGSPPLPANSATPATSSTPRRDQPPRPARDARRRGAIDHERELPNEWRARFGDAPDLAGRTSGHPVAAPGAAAPHPSPLRSDRPVPEALLRLLLGAAFSASSKSDFQQASVIRVAERGRRDRLAALVPDMPWIGNAPVFLVFCGDARRLERIGELRAHRTGERPARRLFQRRDRRRPGLADLHPGSRDRQPRLLSDQRDPQPRRRGRRDPGITGQGLSRSPGCASAIPLRRALSACACRSRSPSTPTVTTIPRSPPRSTPTTAAAPPAICRRASSSAPPDTFGYADFYGWSEDKARQAAAQPEGQTFPSHLRARGFTFD